jgi:ribonuclease HI
VRQLTKVQKRAAIIISGAFRATAAEALNIELYLLPMKMQLEARAEEAALRIATGPEIGRPRGWKETRSRKAIKLGGLTPMETFLRKGCLQPIQGEPDEWEAREAFIQPPWRQPPTTIIESKEKATESHQEIYQLRNLDRNLLIYTDGSGYQGHIGAAAYSPQIGSVQSLYLGSEEAGTVYAAEMAGMEMATQLCTQLRDRSGNGMRFDEVTIFSDSQAAIRSLQRPGRASGLQILGRILQNIEDLLPTLKVTIRWIPGHEGIPGNEAVDRAAKNAAEKGRDGINARLRIGDLPAADQALPGPAYHPETRRLAAAMKVKIRRGAKIQWEKQWSANSTTAAPTRQLVKTPGKSTLEVYNGLHKAWSSVMVQMRTGRIGLSGFLAKIGIRDSNRCDCDEGIQTPQHILLECDHHVEIRGEMLRKIGKKVSNCLDYATLVSEPKVARYVSDFMLKTGLLDQFKAIDTTHDDDDV